MVGEKINKGEAKDEYLCRKISVDWKMGHLEQGVVRGSQE